ncbi:MAG: molybdopterin-binding/glycosyltransferase family 2 protein [Alphaproteobacteria bacterium]
MYLGWRPTKLARGALLVHSTNAGKLRLKKGHKLGDDDVAALLAAGIENVFVAEIAAGEVPENDAARRLAEALAGPNMRPGNAGTGRCNLYADRAGILVLDADAVHRFNSVDEGITLATMAPYDAVSARQIPATVKIIPFAVPAASVDRCLDIARGGVVRVAPFRPLRVALVQTRLPGLKPELLEKTVEVTRARLELIGSTLVKHTVCDHTVPGVAANLWKPAEWGGMPYDVILVLGASAIVDRRDVIPEAIEWTGGKIVHFGMPVDPGNLTLVARIGPMYVLGVPGSARSPRLHGSDYILQRIAAGLEVTASDIMRMGVGGLLKELPSRPMPRARAAPAPAATVPRIAAIVLAAGRSTRMQGPNKLLADIEGGPLVRRVAEAACAAGLAEVAVVTGHERAKIDAAMLGLPVRLVHNPRYADGMSTSLKAGVRSLGADVEGALFCLGDMPGIDAALIARLVAAFAPDKGKDIVIPVSGGRRGNPVLIGKRHFPAIMKLRGDVGARELIQARAKSVTEVEAGGDAAFVDLDTPEALAEYRSRLAAESDCGGH